MKKLILSLPLILLGFAGTATAEPRATVEARVDASRLAADENRTYRGDRDGRDWDRSGHSADDLARLNREVRQVRAMIDNTRNVGPRIRERFHRVARSTDYLNEQFRRGGIRGGELRRRADALREDLEGIRRAFRGRHIGVGGWR